MRFRLRVAVAGLAILGAVPGVMAQSRPSNEPDMTIDAATRSSVIDAISKALHEEYVFPDVAAKMSGAMAAHLKGRDYDAITSARNFAQKLTDDLQAVSHDKHLRVRYRRESRPRPPQGDNKPTTEDLEGMQNYGRIINFGFEKVERLEGNIGLLKLNMFFPAEFAGETAVAAMNFLASTDALIVDLRDNGGGDPSMIALLCSYLFSGESVHLNDLYFRPANETQQFWTHPYVPGRRYGDKPVYVLTSKRTFSGAEEYTYNLKTRKRATIIGETTGGGANPGGIRQVADHFEVFVPSGRAINPVTKINWEGTGVAPDVAVPADQALHVAYLKALERLGEESAKSNRKPTTGPGPELLAEERSKALVRVRKELDAKKHQGKEAKSRVTEKVSALP